jgi:hypothetical protein
VLVTEVTLGNVAVQAGHFGRNDPVTPFQANDDWIQNLSIYLLIKQCRSR